MQVENPTIECQMLIRKPAKEVFQAFVDPKITTKFWFTHSTGELDLGKTVKWKWEMYGAEATIKVKSMVQNQSIIYDWGDPATTVEMTFTEMSAQSTYVVIKNYGFRQKGEELLAAIKDGTGGFTTVLDAAKAYLEHGINLNLIADKFPMNKAGH